MSRHPLQIAYVLPSLEIGGMEQFVVQLASAMQARGHQPSIFCTSHEGPLASTARDAGTPVHVVAFKSRWDNFMPSAMVAHLRSAHPDVVHSQNGVWLPAAVAARLTGVTRMIHTEHGLQSDSEPWKSVVMKTIAARLTSSIVSVSTPLQTALAEHTHVDARTILRIDNGIPLPAPDLDGAIRRAVRRELALPDDAFVVGSVARLDPLKGVDVLIEAMAALAMTTPLAQLLIVGDGDERASLEALAARAPIPVRFLGMRRDVRRILTAFDCFALPSRSEGLPLAILEAMASGVPVVATRVGEVSTVLGDGELGLIVPPLNAVALAAAIAEVARHPRDAASRAANAVLAVRRHYGIEQMAERYERLYYGLSLDAANASETTSRIDDQR